jgi:ribonuclease T2
MQPLFGMNRNLKPLYVQKGDGALQCLRGIADAEFCLQSARETPQEGWSPAFVAWPLTTAHVQTLLSFAHKHELCVAVAGTGHDFLNRHSCDQGLMIRTAMLKGIQWDLEDARGLGHASVRLGAGLVFAEVMESGSRQRPSSYIASGWAQTVGVVGWHLGGGHGPNGKSLGLGVDNLLEVELVLSNGTVVVANKKQHSELFWALRGGGGSTWGVITAVTARAHARPKGNFSMISATTTAALCEAELGSVSQFLQDWALLTANLSSKWNGLSFFTPSKVQGPCGANVSMLFNWNYHGSSSEGEFEQRLRQLEAMPLRLDFSVSSYDSWWAYIQKKDIAEDAVVTVAPGPHGVLSSVAVSEDVARQQLPDFLTQSLRNFRDGDGATTHQFYHLAGDNAPMAAASEDVSVSPAFHNAMFHYVTSAPTPEGLYSLGDASYFGESAYEQDGDSWKVRYWGANYERLLNVKRSYDPTNFFWCHHCVGSDLPRPYSSRLETAMLV